jgi:hypothetical protein
MTAGLNVAGLLELALLLVAVGALSGFLSPAYSASAAARSRRRYVHECPSPAGWQISLL